MTSHKIRTIAGILALLVILAIGAVVIMLTYFKPEICNETIIAKLRKEFKRNVQCDNTSFELRPIPSITLSHFAVMERDGITPFLTTEDVTCRISLLPLLRGQIVLKEIILSQPNISLVHHQDGKWNIQDLLEAPQSLAVMIKAVTVEDGTLEIADRKPPSGEEFYRLRHMKLSWIQTHRTREARFMIKAFLDQKETQADLDISGVLKLAAAGKSMLKSEADIIVRTGNLDMGSLTPHILPSSMSLNGRLDTESRLISTADTITIQGKSTINTLHFGYPRVFQSTLAPKIFQASYKITMEDGSLLMKDIRIVSDNMKLGVKGSLKNLSGKDPFIDLRVTGTMTARNELDPYIPYGLFNDSAKEFIKNRVTGGRFQILEGILHGSVNQFANIDRDENAGILYIKLGVENGSVIFQKPPLDFQNLEGILEMKDGQMNFHHFTGSFGKSPIIVEGSITNLYNPRPTSYPFTATMQPMTEEMARILGVDTVKKLSYAGVSSLQVTGQGTLNDYTFTGMWDLTGASYAYPKVVEKIKGRSNHLSIQTNFHHAAGWSLPSLVYKLPPLVVNASIHPRSSKPGTIDANVHSNPVNIQDLVSELPVLKEWEPRGQVEAALHGRTTTSKLADIIWKGQIILKDASCKVKELPVRIEDINGTIRLNDHALFTSHLNVRIGHSALTGEATIPNWSGSAAGLSFSSKEVNLGDFGLAGPAEIMALKTVRGSILIEKDLLTVRSLSAQAHHSSLALTGKVSLKGKPQADINLNALHLDMDDILLLTRLNWTGHTEQPIPALRAMIHADTGNLRNVPFSKLSAGIEYHDPLLEIKALSFETFNGKCTATMRAMFPPVGIPSYAGTVVVREVSMEKLQQALEVQKGLISGKLSMDGFFIIRGRTKDELARSSNGLYHISISRGVLKKFALLSKIFSVLNVSQLFSLQLPDMVSGGMPYDEIKGTLTVRDGIIVSNDLFMHSEAMNMSFIGQTDLVHQTSDMTVGVQPLQTLDRTVRHLPVVGWLLTDEQKKFISVYFSVKGPWADLSVTPIPVKSLTSAVMGIFRNLFQLPVKLFTDTGDVIFGR